MQPPPTERNWSALFSNQSEFGLDNYVVKRPLLEEVSWSQLPCPIRFRMIQRHENNKALYEVVRHYTNRVEGGRTIQGDLLIDKALVRSKNSTALALSQKFCAPAPNPAQFL